MAAAYSITCTAVTPTNDWITDRRPTAADGDEDGDVRARRSPGDSGYSYLHWSYVGEATPWKHSAGWQPSATPRKFKETPRRTVAPGGYFIDAIDEDGVAWLMAIATRDPKPEWHKLTPLPAKEAAQ